jgi:hypothetical protein
MFRAVLLLAALGVCAALVTTIIAEHAGDASADFPASSSDCRAFTGTPTVTSAPQPTPPWIPFYSILICNDTATAASDLHLFLDHPAANYDPAASVSGCPYPAYTHSGADPPYYTVIDINYGTPCIDPGDQVYVFLDAHCVTPQPGCGVPRVNCFYWTLSGQPAPSVSPAVLNPNRCQNPQPVPTPEPQTPTPRNGTDTPPPSPYYTPTPTPNPVLIATIQNETNKIARGLILHSHHTDGLMVVENPPGCPDPNIDFDINNLDPLYITWPIPCVDPGETFSIHLSNVCSPCAPPEVYAHEWTFTTPTPSGQTKSPTPSPTPTPTSSPTATSHPSATPVITPASLPHSGAATEKHGWLFVWLLAGLALAFAGFALARRAPNY